MIVIKLKTIVKYAAAALLAVALLFSLRPDGREALPASGLASPEVSLLIDAGHGGPDGGAVSENGLVEAGVNLLIAQKTQALLRFLGVSGVLTRADEGSLDYDPNVSIRGNKVADIRARLALAQGYPSCDFLSIHLNKFTDARYYGAQVFYSPNHPLSRTLAETLQLSLRDTLDSGNNRKAAAAQESVFLMKHITSPAVVVECGFLSNEAEAAKLQTDAYQTKIAVAIAGGYMTYQSSR